MVTYLHNLVMNDMPFVTKMQRIYTDTLMTSFSLAGMPPLSLSEPLKYDHRQSLEEVSPLIVQFTFFKFLNSALLEPFGTGEKFVLRVTWLGISRIVV